MCTTCGCGKGETQIDGTPVGAHEHEHEHEHRHADGTVHAHPHEHSGDHAHGHDPHGHWHADGTWHSHVHDGGSAHTHASVISGASAAAATGTLGTHAPGVSPERMLRIEQGILAKNNAFAADNRRWLADHGIFALNLVSSPGSGKTTILVRTIEALRGRMPLAVIEGDQQTSLDADRIRATGAPAVQVNTGKGCHLDAHTVGQAMATLQPADDGLLLIENVGNLVCPAAFDLGEAHKVVILSVTEGEDKPLKYPDMFHAADLLLINKVDLLPYVRFDVDAAIGYARRVRPGLEAIHLSATTGEGFDAWIAWLERGAEAVRARHVDSVDALRRRIAALEAELASRDRGG